MAQRQIVEMIDDLTGEVLENGRRVLFSFEGVDYQIDLSDKNSEKFSTLLEPYLQNAMRVTKRRRTESPASRTGSEAPLIRAWAKENGFQVSDRGRIRPEVVAAYRKAHH